LAGYFVHWLLHTDRFAKLAPSHNIHHTLYTPDDFESETYRDAEENDSVRVFVPIITGAIVLASIPLWFIFHTWWIYPIILAEGAFVGWLNDYIHECFHIIDHPYNKYSYFKKLKRLHLIHHIFPKKNHAIIWFGPDRLFGTFSK
jgi:sterol desaturase/sphingolipid hydroxylase (fatty acid hydroxylase superfamily)